MKKFQMAVLITIIFTAHQAMASTNENKCTALINQELKHFDVGSSFIHPDSCTNKFKSTSALCEVERLVPVGRTFPAVKYFSKPKRLDIVLSHDPITGTDTSYTMFFNDDCSGIREVNSSELPGQIISDQFCRLGAIII